MCYVTELRWTKYGPAKRLVKARNYFSEFLQIPLFKFPKLLLFNKNYQR